MSVFLNNAIEDENDVRKCPESSDSDESSQPAPPDLGEKQWMAIDLLACGKSFTAVARQMKIDPRTLHRWRQDERFAWELSRLRRSLWQHAAERLAGMVHPALDILEQQMQDGYDRSRFRAASAVLRHARLHTQVDPLGEG